MSKIMNKLFMLISVFVAITACSTQNNKSNNSTEPSETIKIDKKQLIKQAELLDGYYLSDNYLKNIEKTRSIYLNREYKTKLFGFTLKKENLLSDSAGLFGYTVHEGGLDCPLIFDFDKSIFVNDLKSVKEFDDIKEPFELSLTADNIVQMYFPESKQTDLYRKVTDDQTELRKILFEGEYLSGDQQNKYSFKRDGSLKGFDDKKYYEVVYDFSLGIEYDAIIFFNKKRGNWSDGDMYKYEFSSDTLKLYHIKTDWDNLEHKIGDITFTLIKKNN
jgi:hypothetical protein